jgi:Cobalamin biosynthesis protein CbiK, Co2+ chelatase
MNKHIKALASVALAAAVAVTMSIPVLGTGRAYAADTADTAETASTDIVSDLGMFTPLSGDTVTVNRNNATVKVKFSTKSMSRQYTKLALVSQTKSDAEKNKSAASASVSETSTGKYSSTFTISIPVEKIGTKLPVSYYQKFTKSDGTKVDGWYNFDAQHYLTVVNTPDIVSQLEDAIYYQEWTKTTNRLCAQARKSWDALTDAEKHEVKEFGYYKDTDEQKGGYDYFGLDTGDASKDNPLNANGIGKKELLVVSFGTSFNNSRIATIGGVEKALKTAYPSYSVRRGFTSQIIINHIQARDNECIDNIDQAMDRAVKNKVNTLVVQSTTLMSGAEYNEMKDEINQYKDDFGQIVFSKPLCSSTADKDAVATAIYKDAASLAGFSDVKTASESKDTAFVFMGHGTSHEAAVLYDEMQDVVSKLGYKNCFIGTVEGKPADTSCESVIAKVKAAGYSKVILRPLMVVAGDHANNDMAGSDADSWKSRFTAAGCSTSCQIKGLGQLEDIQKIYTAHAKAAISSVVPTKETYIVSLNAGTGKAVVKVKKQSNMSGYQIRYSTGKTFKNSKTATVKGSGKTVLTLNRLKSKKTYYFEARTYKIKNGKKYCSRWSTAKKALIK